MKNVRQLVPAHITKEKFLDKIRTKVQVQLPHLVERNLQNNPSQGWACMICPYNTLSTQFAQAHGTRNHSTCLLRACYEPGTVVSITQRVIQLISISLGVPGSFPFEFDR